MYTANYLTTQPIPAVNPEPRRVDGVLISFGVKESSHWAARAPTAGSSQSSPARRCSPPASPGRPSRRQRPASYRLPWDADRLIFSVREPFTSRTSRASLSRHCLSSRLSGIRKVSLLTTSPLTGNLSVTVISPTVIYLMSDF